MFKNTSPNTVWQQIGILFQYTGLELFGLTHKITYEAIKEICHIAIQDALDNNLRGPNGTQQILSIVANKFTYNEIQANLKINPTRLTKDKLEAELDKRKIDYKGLKRNELVNILQEKMTQEILSSDVNAAGWALKEPQKFGIKGKGKRISKNMVPLLEAFFLAGDANKSDRYIAEDMLNELHSMAHEGLLEDDEIPKLTTMQKNTAKILQNNQSKHQRLIN
ncbi:45255_t:CDS:2 [Gigaspora margarita]|uniref:45255_t:CDS:1 n=1 Tax=Gigaspora margarita TaxID=4874 RepID=A0ABN7V5H9_GIGMA|nr:45255_t:CDS:2 [Gigaspora margarita]